MIKYIDAEQFKRDNERLLHCDFPYLAEETLEELIDNAPAADIPRWIPVTERLPEEHEEVLTYDSVFGITFDSQHNGKWRKHPVAWMPLPEPYKEGEQDE